MNIESVKERIASLEAAGELTIKERIYLYSMKEHIALEAQVKQLAAENAALKSAISNLQNKYMNWEGLSDAFDAALNMETPATDTAIASLRAEGHAEGVDMAIQHLHSKFEGTGHIGVPVMALEWLSAQLRSQSEQVKGVQS